jgi:flagellar biosynthetic protein FliO
METESLTRALLSLVFVLGLIGLLAWGLRKMEGTRLARSMKAGRRLQVVEQLYIDPKNKLVLARLDDREHLLLVNPQHSVAIESHPAKVTENAAL